MNKLNWIFTFASLNLILVSIERFSFTGQILLQPYNFLRLHEVVQLTTLILFTVILHVFMLKEVTKDFALLKKSGFTLLLLFIIGIYFYATGNGLHEVSNFNLSMFCDSRNVSGTICGSFFFNNYYTGNILFFIGAMLMVLPLILFEQRSPADKFNKKNLIILLVNACFYGLAIFAYAAFDLVLVGFVYTSIMALIAIGFFLKVRYAYATHPFLVYVVVAYTIGAAGSFVIRFLL